MATATYKILAMTGSAGNYGNGAATFSATTNTNLYQVPASTQTVVSTITICNQAASSATFRIAVRPAAATLAVQHYIAYDVTIAANDTTALTLGLTLNNAGTGDIVTVYGSASTLSFALFGSELA